MEKKQIVGPAPLAVVCDLDGTLVWQGQNQPTDRTLRCFEALRRRGVLIVIATGRIRQLVPQMVEPLADYFVCGNGGIVLDAGGQVLHQISFAPDLVEELAAFSDKIGGALSFSFPSGYGAYRDFGRISEMYLCCTDRPLPLRDESALRDRHRREAPFSSFLIGNEGRVYDYLRHQPRLQGARQWEDHFDVYPVATTKAVGISEVLRRRGISWAQVAAFGDSPNDLEMLAAAGMGFAMGNASPEAKQMARYEAPTVWEDGVAQVLEQVYGLYGD